MTSGRLPTRQSFFVDTSAFVAVLDPGDRNHRSALAIMDQLASAPTQLVTSNFILAETHALTLARLGRRTALRFLDELDQSSTTVFRVTPADEQRARAILRQYDDKNFSLTDTLSFSIMERNDISGAFAFDVNFAQFGLTVLTA